MFSVYLQKTLVLTALSCPELLTWNTRAFRVVRIKEVDIYAVFGKWLQQLNSFCSDGCVEGKSPS